MTARDRFIIEQLRLTALECRATAGRGPMTDRDRLVVEEIEKSYEVCQKHAAGNGTRIVSSWLNSLMGWLGRRRVGFAVA